MKKDFGVKTWLLPMPVLMVASYGEGDLPNVMAAPWALPSLRFTRRSCRIAACPFRSDAAERDCVKEAG